MYLAQEYNTATRVRIELYTDFDIWRIKDMTGERGGSVVVRRTPERKVGGSKPTSPVLCP